MDNKHLGIAGIPFCMSRLELLPAGFIKNSETPISQHTITCTANVLEVRRYD
jgi:hypothetical protein